MKDSNNGSTPAFSAYVDDTTIIPFANVEAVAGDIMHNDELILTVKLKSKDASVDLNGYNASTFMDQYKTYLRLVELEHIEGQKK